MADEIEIRRTVPLHTLRLTWDAPPVLTSGALVTPINNFAILYRMASGIYGQAGYRRMDQPFRYARPYIASAQFGSPLSLEVIVSTAIPGGAIARVGLPKLVELIKQVMLLPSSSAAERQKSKRDQKEAELERVGIEEQLAHPGDVKRQARAQQLAEIAEAETRRSALLQRQPSYWTRWTPTF